MDSQFIISTDLDGTLLDHHTYKYNKAVPALEYCDEQNIPIIFNTSKTFSETEKLCKQLDIIHPFIIENGSALYIPKDYFPTIEDESVPCYDAGDYWLFKFGLNRNEILSRLVTFKSSHDFEFKGFSQYSSHELAKLTGLTLTQAIQAQERQFSEPINWLGTEEQLSNFKKLISLFGLNAIRGGRFVHVQGKSDKSKPLMFLKSLYQRFHNTSQKLIALGDGDNDKDMLNCADIAIVIKSPTHERLIISEHKHLIRSKYIGPEGWNDSVMSLLEPVN
ncbi:HAD-IIB family hydrolase [Thalassotalea crassostreae]|uniref:HAD-IIB family hydrolase n=1 Tax=Thalassotalea crassostreae TaxID=1763536 RepID=UPI000839873A|nr:HAD-IIB family hydrolase [Thalassotalea crassostreae]